MVGLNVLQLMNDNTAGMTSQPFRFSYNIFNIRGGNPLALLRAIHAVFVVLE